MKKLLLLEHMFRWHIVWHPMMESGKVAAAHFIFFPSHHSNNKVAILQKMQPLGCIPSPRLQGRWQHNLMLTVFLTCAQVDCFLNFLQRIETTIALPFPGKCMVFPGKLGEAKNPRKCVLLYK